MVAACRRLPSQEECQLLTLSGDGDNGTFWSWGPAPWSAAAQLDVVLCLKSSRGRGWSGSFMGCWSVDGLWNCNLRMVPATFEFVGTSSCQYNWNRTIYCSGLNATLQAQVGRGMCRSSKKAAVRAWPCFSWGWQGQRTSSQHWVFSPFLVRRFACQNSKELGFAIHRSTQSLVKLSWSISSTITIFTIFTIFTICTICRLWSGRDAFC